MREWQNTAALIAFLAAILFGLAGFGMALAGVEAEWPFAVAGFGFGITLGTGLTLTIPDE